jgi:hypothetical protein
MMSIDTVAGLPPRALPIANAGGRCPAIRRDSRTVGND